MNGIDNSSDAATTRPPPHGPHTTRVTKRGTYHLDHSSGPPKVAETHGCSDTVRVDFAERRETVAPSDAIGVYEPIVLAAITTKKTPGYQRAVHLMERIERLAPVAGTPERWESLLYRVRTEHKAKRNLRKLLDQRGR
jgi:hypothetical protein